MKIHFFNQADNTPGLVRAMKDWPDSWDNELRRLLETTTNHQIAKQLGASPGLVGFRIKRLGLTRTPEAHERLYGTLRGRLVSGMNVKNQQAPGTIKWIKKHKNRPAEKPEWWIFLGKGERMPLRRYLWLTWIGPIPKGYNVIFVDHNPRRCVLSNLECIPNSEMAGRNRNLIKMSLTNRNTWASPKGEERRKRHSEIMRRFWQSDEGNRTLVKRSDLIRQMNAAGLINNPFRNLHDTVVAYYISQDPEIKKILLEDRPDLIELKRTEILLKRAINKHNDESKAEH
ncbi:HNH endonuclease [Spirosoma aerophilum]